MRVDERERMEGGTDVTENYANLPRVVSRDEWTAAREELLVKEELTRKRDALSADAAGCRWSGSRRNTCSKDPAGERA